TARMSREHGLSLAQLGLFSPLWVADYARRTSSTTRLQASGCSRMSLWAVPGDDDLARPPRSPPPAPWRTPADPARHRRPRRSASVAWRSQRGGRWPPAPAPARAPPL